MSNPLRIAPLHFALGISLLSACDDEMAAGPRPLGEGPAQPRGHVDGSCAKVDGDACGEQSPDGCWCDEACAQYGDCCADYEPVCLCDCDDPDRSPACAATCPPTPVCGDGVIDPGEACDGAALGDESCASLGHTGGALTCDAACAYDESGCTDAPACTAWAGGPLAFELHFTAALELPRAARIGDLDGDGDGDLVVVSRQGSNDGFVLYDNDGSGGFSEATRFADAWWPQRPLVVDLDADGTADLVGIAASGGLAVNTRLVVRRGLGGFSYAAPVVYSVPNSGTREVELADLDTDGDLDAVLGGTGRVGVRLGNGSGGFGALVTHTLTAGSALSVEIADTDANGTLDVVAQTATGVCRLLGNGNGTLAGASQVCTAIGSDVGDLVAGQFTSDSALDLAYVRQAGTRFGLALGGPGGTLASEFREVDTMSQTARRLERGDLDCDGLADFVPYTSGTLLDAFEVHRTDGEGGLLDPIVEPLASPMSLDLGDLDGDGADDIVVAQSRTSGIGQVQRVAVMLTRGQ